MSHYQIPYIPLSTNGWALPSVAPARRWTWSHVAFAFASLSNLFLIWAWWRARSHTGFAPLDDYQILKDEFSLIAPTNPNATAIVSSLYNDLYLLPVLVLGHSISKHYDQRTPSTSLPSPHRLLLYIPGRISPLSLCLVRAAGWTPHAVSYIPPPHGGKGVHYRFADQYTKLGLWTLDQIGIERAVYLDGDTLVRARFDELFALPFRFAAVPDAEAKDPGFSLGFNAGVLALKPDTAVFDVLVAQMDRARFPLRMAEQAYLNLFFGAEAVRLPYVYNANLAIKLRSPQLWEFMRRGDAIRIVHYTTPKPFDVSMGGSSSGKAFLSDAREKARRKIGDGMNFYDGVYYDEIGWWEDAWLEMERERQAAFERCEQPGEL